MNKVACVIASAIISLGGASATVAQQTSGTVGSGAPEDMMLEVTVGADGPVLSASEFRLAQGGYYRFNLVCPANLENEAGINFRAPELLSNAHLRLLSVGDIANDNEINFHLQGLNFRQIDCEGMNAAARFSFHPMRKGTYPFSVRTDEDPPREATGNFIVE